MRSRTPLRLFLAANTAALLFSPALRAAETPAPAPQPAGAVSDLVPRVWLTRAKLKLDVQVRDPVFLRDLLETQKKARVRLELLDGAVVNLGPRSKFAVVEMNETTQQSLLVLVQGRLRAQIQKRTHPNGRFQVHTRTAVIGVIGTEEFVAAFPEETIVANLSDDPTALLWVRSSDPKIDVVVIVKPGYGTRVPLGREPTPPRPWGKKELERARDDSREFSRYDADFARDYPHGFPLPDGSYVPSGTYGRWPGDIWDDRGGSNRGPGSSSSGSGSSSSGKGKGR